MKKIGLAGAHGTGKSTLREIIVEEIGLYSIDRTLRDYWEENGIEDFEKLSPDARALHQKHIIMRQIEREESEGRSGFVTDRTVLDIIGYLRLSSNMSGIDLKVFEELTRLRMQKYTHFIYVPVEFEAEPERLRAHPSSQREVADFMESYLEKWLKSNEYLVVRGTVEERMEQIREYLK